MGGADGMGVGVEAFLELGVSGRSGCGGTLDVLKSSLQR